ncbi:MAG: histidine--tRNA ligase [Planctomycetes bacterium]|nr:histidine--tRNA ligase [Planctomycetota bacterium]
MALLQAPVGTRDLLPEELAAWRHVEGRSRDWFERYGYQELRTPLFEYADLFQRGIGEVTDIVEKEMYTFSRGERLYALRPEQTASIVRAYIEHDWASTRRFRKFWYMGPQFRHERKQRHRYRQFYQMGVEAIGSTSPTVDAETMVLAWRLLRDLGVRDLVTELNTIGCAACRPAFRERLREATIPRQAELCPHCQRRLERNVLRLLDCKEPGCAAIARELPRVVDHLCEGCGAHFDAVRGALDALAVEYRVNPLIVRGLDYYSRTVCEFSSPGLGGSQNALGGGGRYDGLLPLLGGPDVGAVGFALGTDRIVEALGAPLAAPPAMDAYVVAVDEESRRDCLLLAERMRTAGLSCELDHEGRSLQKQLRQAHRLGALRSVVVGPEERGRRVARVKVMETGEEREVAFDDLARPEGVAPRGP